MVSPSKKTNRMKFLLPLLCIYLITMPCFAQEKVIIDLNIPHSNMYINDYDNSVEFQNITLNETLNVYLQWSIEGDNGYRVNCDFNQFSPIQLLPNARKSLRIIDFANQTSANITNTFPTEVQNNILKKDGILPEGTYRFCIQAFDNRQRALSKAGQCEEIVITYPKPPTLDEVLCIDEARITHLPYLFKWRIQEGNFKNLKITYNFYLVKRDSALNINETMLQAIDNQTVFKKSKLTIESYAYSVKDMPLVTGQYVWMVQMMAITRNNKRIFIENEGKSEVCSFMYEKPTQPLKKDSVEKRSKNITKIDSLGNRFDPCYLFVKYRPHISPVQRAEIRKRYTDEAPDLFKYINPLWEGWKLLNCNSDTMLALIEKQEQDNIQDVGLNYIGTLQGHGYANANKINFGTNIALKSNSALKIGFIDGFDGVRPREDSLEDSRQPPPNIQYINLIKNAYSITPEASEHGNNVYFMFKKFIKNNGLLKAMLITKIGICTDMNNIDYKTVFDAIDTCLEKKIKVVNLSLVFERTLGTNFDTLGHDFFKKLCNEEVKNRLILVCAAGNYNIDLDKSKNRKYIPACFAADQDNMNLISVAAMDSDGKLKNSNYGYKSVTIAVFPKGNHEIATSYATPIITAAIAYYLTNHEINMVEIRKWLQDKCVVNPNTPTQLGSLKTEIQKVSDLDKK